MWFWASCQKQGIKEKGERYKEADTKREPEETGETKLKLADEKRGKCDVRERKKSDKWK